MNNFFYKSKGAISIFLLLVLVPMMTLGAVLIDGTRKMSADQIVQGATDSAAMSVLADFDSVLKSEFGLFALENPENATADFENYLKKTLMASYSDDPTYTEMAWQYVKSFMLNKENLANMNFYNFYDFQIENASVTPMYSLANPEVLENQIVEYMKYRAPVEIVKSTDILGVFEQAQQLGDVKGSMDLLKKKNKFDKKKMKLQAAVGDFILDLQTINELTIDVINQWKTDDFLKMKDIKDYDSMINNTEDSDMRSYYERCKRDIINDFEREIKDHIEYLETKIDLSDVSSNNCPLKKKVEKIKNEADKLKEEAQKLKTELTPYASKEGMEGDTAKEILEEVDSVLELSGYEQELDNKINTAEQKHEGMKNYRNEYKTFMEPKPDEIDKDTNLDKDIKDDDGNIEIGLKDEYDRYVTPYHSKAAKQIDTSFPKALQFGSDKKVSDDREQELKDYKSNQSPDSDESKNKLESEKEGINKKLKDIGVWDTLPSQNELKEPDFSALNDIDSSYVKGKIESLTNDVLNSTENEDILNKLKNIDFDDEKNNGFFSKVGSGIKNFLGWITGNENIEEEKTAFDDVASVSDILFNGVENFAEGIRDNIYVNTYATSRFKSRMTVDPGELPKITSDSEAKEKHVVNWRYATQPVNGSQKLVGALDLRNRPKYQNKSTFDNGELEYILIGNQSEAWNENQVYAYIYGLRLANNIVAVYLNSTVNTTCLEAATALAGWWTFGIGIPILHWAFMMAVASAETFIEMDYLVNKGYKIPLIKHGKNLNICPDGDSFEIGNGGVKTVPNFYDVDFGVCYEDFLSIFMFTLVNKNTKLQRIGDLIQMDYRAITGKNEFKLNEAYTYIRVDADASIDFKFIPAFDLSGVAKDYNGRMHNRNIIYHGY